MESLKIEIRNHPVASNVVISVMGSGAVDQINGGFIMMYFKECPRCQGDLHSNRDMYGEYKECLQCGYMVDIEKPNSLFSAQVLEAKKKAA